MAALVKTALGRATDGWVLDGYPRNVEQARQLAQDVHVEKVVAITMRRDLLVRKLAGRRVCADCGGAFNVENIDEDGIFMPPLLPKGEYNGQPCGDHCIPRLTRRADDVHEVGPLWVTYDDRRSVG